jgi:hypothetical protein
MTDKNEQCCVCHREPVTLSYNVAGVPLAVGDRCWESHCAGRINLKSLCVPPVCAEEKEG